MEYVLVYVDGSGIAAGGPAGAAYVAVAGTLIVEGSVEILDATNQQAELTAAAYGLEEIDPAERVMVYSDSQYVVKGMNQWMRSWVNYGWTTQEGRPVANQDLWHRLVDAKERHAAVGFSWLRGHNGHVWNERADELAGLARRSAIEVYALG